VPLAQSIADYPALLPLLPTALRTHGDRAEVVSSAASLLFALAAKCSLRPVVLDLLCPVIEAAVRRRAGLVYRCFKMQGLRRQLYDLFADAYVLLPAAHPLPNRSASCTGLCLGSSEPDSCAPAVPCFHCCRSQDRHVCSSPALAQDVLLLMQRLGLARAPLDHAVPSLGPQRLFALPFTLRCLDAHHHVDAILVPGLQLVSLLTPDDSPVAIPALALVLQAVQSSGPAQPAALRLVARSLKACGPCPRPPAAFESLVPHLVSAVRRGCGKAAPQGGEECVGDALASLEHLLQVRLRFAPMPPILSPSQPHLVLRDILCSCDAY
jgi:hypothetical protein